MIFKLRLKDVTERISDETEIIELINKQCTELKKVLATRYEHSVTNGITTLKVVDKKSPIDYRQAFEFIDGEKLLLNKESDIENFRRNSNSRQITITSEERA